jgi:hypothetical protein
MSANYSSVCKGCNDKVRSTEHTVQSFLQFLKQYKGTDRVTFNAKGVISCETLSAANKQLETVAHYRRWATKLPKKHRLSVTRNPDTKKLVLLARPESCAWYCMATMRWH